MSRSFAVSDLNLAQADRGHGRGKGATTRRMRDTPLQSGLREVVVHSDTEDDVE